MISHLVSNAVITMYLSNAKLCVLDGLNIPYHHQQVQKHLFCKTHGGLGWEVLTWEVLTLSVNPRGGPSCKV